MAISTRLTLYVPSTSEPAAELRQVFECEPSWWNAEWTSKLPGMQQVQLTNGYLDFVGKFTPEEVLRLEEESWPASIESKWPGSYALAVESHQRLVELLSPPSPIAEVRVRVFEWDTGMD